MKTVKLKKKYLSDLDFMYRDLGLVENNSCDPGRVYLSEEDLKTLRKNIRTQFKKKYPNLDSRRLESSIGMYLLNLEPNSSLSKALKPGYVLIEN